MVRVHPAAVAFDTPAGAMQFAVQVAYQNVVFSAGFVNCMPAFASSVCVLQDLGCKLLLLSAHVP